MGLLCIYETHTGQVLQVQTCSGYSDNQDVALARQIKLQHMWYAATRILLDMFTPAHDTCCQGTWQATWQGFGCI